MSATRCHCSQLSVTHILRSSLQSGVLTIASPRVTDYRRRLLGWCAGEGRPEGLEGGKDLVDRQGVAKLARLWA